MLFWWYLQSRKVDTVRKDWYNFTVKAGVTGVIMQSDNENSVTNVIKAVEKMRLSQGMPTTVRV